MAQERLLAVDLGLRTGLALFAKDGQLLWYRSHNLGNIGRLKRAVASLLREEGLQWLVLEGGGQLAEVWKKAAEKIGLSVLQVDAQRWRSDLLLPREQRRGREAKQAGISLARKTIAQCGGKAPVALRHDAAEAILVGYWALKRLGWIP